MTAPEQQQQQPVPDAENGAAGPALLCRRLGAVTAESEMKTSGLSKVQGRYDELESAVNAITGTRQIGLNQSSLRSVLSVQDSESVFEDHDIRESAKFANRVWQQHVNSFPRTLEGAVEPSEEADGCVGLQNAARSVPVHLHEGWGIADSDAASCVAVAKSAHAVVEHLKPSATYNADGGSLFPLLSGVPSTVTRQRRVAVPSKRGSEELSLAKSQSSIGPSRRKRAKAV